MPTRRFTILDGMILMMAAAFGSFVVSRYEYTYMVSYSVFPLSDGVPLPSFSATVGSQTPFGPYSWKVIHWGIWTSLVLSAFMPALLGLRLLPPRPRVRRLFRQPGATACLAASLALLVSVIPSLTTRLPVRVVPNHGRVRWGFVGSYSAGMAVAGAWLTQTVLGRWRPEPSALDRIGRVLGLYWIGIAAFQILAGF